MPRQRRPGFQVGIGGPDELYVETYDGKLHRRATPREVESLRVREVVSAIVVQNALQAFHHVIPKEEGDERVLDYAYVQQLAKVAI